MTLPTLTPTEAARRVREEGALLVDVRAPDEHARARIPGARNLPLAGLGAGSLEPHRGAPVLFHCKTGARTAGHAAALAACAGGLEAYIVEGGLDAWRAAGLPVAEDRRAPLEILRQVQIAAGGLVLLGLALGFLLGPAGFGLAGFVGAGLVFSGVSGTCAMATLLRRLPWNRAPA
jgi:rhodanese-related sulfurtransferase